MCKGFYGFGGIVWIHYLMLYMSGQPHFHGNVKTFAKLRLKNSTRFHKHILPDCLRNSANPESEICPLLRSSSLTSKMAVHFFFIDKLSRSNDSSLWRTWTFLAHIVDPKMRRGAERAITSGVSSGLSLYSSAGRPEKKHTLVQAKIAKIMDFITKIPFRQQRYLRSFWKLAHIFLLATHYSLLYRLHSRIQTLIKWPHAMDVWRFGDRSFIKATDLPSK